jgi:hypothetical protein
MDSWTKVVLVETRNGAPNEVLKWSQGHLHCGNRHLFSQKTYLSTYYSLSATKGNVDSRPLGDSTVLAGADTLLLTGTNAAVNYPETVNRSTCSAQKT